MKTFLFRSMIGIFFGAFLAVIFTNLVVLIGVQDVLNGQMFLKNSLGSIFCGWFFTVSPLFFENPNLRLAQQTGLHFLTVVMLYFVLALGIGWVPFNWSSFLSAIVLFIAFYIVFWIVFYMYFRSQAKKLNEDLKSL